jgi:hypothetical protein
LAINNQILKKTLAIVLFFCSFNLNAQKAFFGAQNNEPARVVQSALAPNIITNGLLVHLDANYSSSYGGSGNTWRDIAGSNNGTIVGGTFVNSGGVSFFNFTTTGVNSYVSIPHTKTNSMTFSVWAKSSNYPVSNSMLFNTGTVGAGGGPNFLLASNFVLWNIWDSFGTPFKDGSNTDLDHRNIITNTGWHNYTIVADNNNNIRFYYDGVLKGTSAYWSPIRSSATAFFLGSAGAGDTGWNFIGGIAAFLSYNRVLTQSEITANFNAVKSRYGL